MIFYKVPFGLAAPVFSSLMFMACAATAQVEILQKELATVRQMRAENRTADASDRASGEVFRQALESVRDTALKEGALWEAADVHLSEANKWRASQHNGYARRAVEAWTAYVDFAAENGTTTRVHSAVEYLQRSFFQANEYPEMFSYFLLLPPKYINDKVVIRWEDRLRACSDYGRQGWRSWVEKECAQEECRDSVAGFYGFLNRWLGEFPLKADARLGFAQRMERVPQSCRPR